VRNDGANTGSRSGFRRKLEELWLSAVRLYTYNTPISKGKYRLYESALRLCSDPPDSVRTQVKDGRQFWVNLTTGMQETVFFLGEFEKEITRIAASLVKKGDVCIDVGANFGWYTTLFYTLAGEGGSVHSFEPVPLTFRELKRNYDLLGSPVNVFINNLALGDREGTVSINLFDDLPTGHASLSSQGRSDAAVFECRMVTLDSYLEERSVGAVNFVKVDIEGAEMMFLQGAKRLFEQDVPPIFLMEMALQTTRNFDYVPNDLIEFIGSQREYDFYAVDEINGRLRKIEEFPEGDIGANVFCIPRGFYRERLGGESW
jgi:FkbM family methyltransferase